MDPTGDRSDQSTADETWQPPLEADPADAQEQSRPAARDDEEVVDPEAPVGGSRIPDLDLSRASEADLAEQLREVPYDDDDGER